MKNLLAFVGVLVILVLAIQPVMAQGTVDVPQVQIGTFSSTGTNLSNGSGDRQMTVAISFPKPFKVKPDVMVSITMVDADTKANVRVSVKAEGISRDGFTAVIKTWADSKISGVEGNWVAVATTTAKVKQ
jgi:hypothetical protein